jgi:glutamine amidotransferase-like uncharacterized protein
MFTRFSPAQRPRALLTLAFTLTFAILTGCGTPNWSGTQKVAPSVMDVAATGSVTPPILLFVGAGTSSGDVAALKTILGNMKLGYATANSSQLNSMSESQITKYKLFLMPGGNAVTISKNLTKTATANVHNAVVTNGMHYLGICAGGFFADNSIYNYLHLTPVLFDFYSIYYNGTHKAAVEIAQPNGTKLDQYWQDGPELNGWGNVVGKYPNGSAAIVEGKSGAGWVILSGIHPEAPASWRTGMKFTTTVAVDNAYAATLVSAALNGSSLPHY